MIQLVRSRSRISEQILATSVVMLGTAYFVQNLFLFDMQVSYALFFSSLAFTGFLMNSGTETKREKELRTSSPAGLSGGSTGGRLALAGAGILTVCALVWGNWVPYKTASLGRESLEANEPSQALALYSKALESGGFPTHEATVAMMEALISSGRSKDKEWANVVQRIEQHLSTIASEESTDPRILIQLGKLYNNRGLTDPAYLAKAEQVLRNAIALAPARPEGYQELGVTHLQRGEGERGMQFFREALAFNERNARARWVLGLALASQKKFEEGMVELEKAMAGGYSWDNPADIGNLSFVYSSINLTDRLLRLYELVVERHPEHTGYRTTLARIKGVMGKTADRNVN